MADRTDVHDERRYARAVREYRNTGSGPTVQWTRSQEHLAEQEQLVQLLWAEGWTVPEIADYAGLGVRVVRLIVNVVAA